MESGQPKGCGGSDWGSGRCERRHRCGGFACSVTVFCWLVVMGLAPMAAQAQSKDLPAPSALLVFRPTLAGCRIRHAGRTRRPIDACKVELVIVQNRSIGYALRDGQGKMLRRFVATTGPQDGPVELLPGRIRGLPRERPGRRPGPGRGAVAERRRHAGRDGQEGEDRRLEADLGGGGLEGLRAGTGAGDGRRRHVAAGDGHGDAGRAGGRRAAPGRGRQGGRGRRVPRREGRRPAQVADRLDPPDGLEPVRRHLSRT